jgi:hypothetical protein
MSWSGFSPLIILGSNSDSTTTHSNKPAVKTTEILYYLALTTSSLASEWHQSLWSLRITGHSLCQQPPNHGPLVPGTTLDAAVIKNKTKYLPKEFMVIHLFLSIYILPISIWIRPRKCLNTLSVTHTHTQFFFVKSRSPTLHTISSTGICKRLPILLEAAHGWTVSILIVSELSTWKAPPPPHHCLTVSRISLYFFPFTNDPKTKQERVHLTSVRRRKLQFSQEISFVLISFNHSPCTYIQKYLFLNIFFTLKKKKALPALIC